MCASDAVPLLNAGGELLGWQGTARDRSAYHLSMHEREERRREIEEVLSGELPFEIVLQPIFDLDTGLAIGAEALARFDTDPRTGRPTCGSRSPGSSDYARQLEVFALGRALEFLDKLPRHMWLSANVSPETFLELSADTAPLAGHRCSPARPRTHRALVGPRGPLSKAEAPDRSAEEATGSGSRSTTPGPDSPASITSSS